MELSGNGHSRPSNGVPRSTDNGVDEASSASRFVAVNGKTSPRHQRKSTSPGQRRSRSRSTSIARKRHGDAATAGGRPNSDGWQSGEGTQSDSPSERRRDIGSPGKRKRADSDEQRFVLGAFTAGGKEMEERHKNNQAHTMQVTVDKDTAWYDPRPRIEDRVREALTAEMQRHDHANSPGSGHGMPDDDDDDRLDHRQHIDYGTDGTPQSSAQFDPRKRKRMFSNRTKTGCLTCRRRKKKCDEAKPECNNCIRGGFVCEGYSLKSVFAKPTAPRTQAMLHNIQSKENYYGHAGAYGSTGYNDLPPPRLEGPDGSRPRSGMVEEPRGHGRASSHNEAASQNFFSRYPPPPAEPAPREYIARPPFDHPRESSRELPALPSSVSQAQRAISVSHSSPSSRQSQALAQQVLALQPTTRSDKQKMLDGDRYQPFNEELVEEREQCKAAIWRFNNSTNPSNGHSRADRERLFKAIIEPEHLRRQTSTSVVRIGKVGRGVAVEAPFMCDYGYNIHIGDEVVIGAGCTIQDPCSVSIGARTILGPNVSIYGMTYSHDPRYRNGSSGPATGKPVIIEEDCLIEGGAIIMGGVKIGKKATIKAGTVVTRNIAPSTVWGANDEHSCICIKGAYDPQSPEPEPRYYSR